VITRARRSLFYLHTSRSSASRMNHRLPAFAFPAETGTHFPTPDGWKAELALMQEANTERTKNHWASWGCMTNE